jgi:hypothetical protein
MQDKTFSEIWNQFLRGLYVAEHRLRREERIKCSVVRRFDFWVIN